MLSQSRQTFDHLIPHTHVFLYRRRFHVKGREAERLGLGAGLATRALLQLRDHRRFHLVCHRRQARRVYQLLQELSVCRSEPCVAGAATPAADSISSVSADAVLAGKNGCDGDEEEKRAAGWAALEAKVERLAARERKRKAVKSAQPRQSQGSSVSHTTASSYTAASSSASSSKARGKRARADGDVSPQPGPARVKREREENHE